VTTDECIALTDDELVDTAYAVVDGLAESENDRTAEAGALLIFLLGELLERFAPEVAQAELVRNLTRSEPGASAAADEAELFDALDGLRRRQAARLLRDALQE
jgi:predicted nucleic acid-binding protein